MDSVESQGAQGGKRKRSLSDDGPLAPPPPPPQSSTAAPVAPGNVTQINYFNKARSDKLRLIEGDSDVFDGILGLIADYEGVLERHESVAANLGAKLVGPILVKSIEKLFEGPIKILQSQYDAEGVTITWLDIIEYAGTKPNSFMLSDTSSGGRVCQFWIKDCLVEISEDDYRLILSGAPERMIPSEPVHEDEVAEVGALEILEQRLNAMVKKADLVAGHARQLRHRLKSRKAAIQARRSGRQADSFMANSFANDGRQPSTPFQAINNRNSINGETQALHENLLRQFQSEARKSVSSLTKTKGARALADSNSPSTPSQSNPKKNPTSGRRNSHTPAAGGSQGEIVGGQYRPAMMARLEKLSRGDAIWPPCDRCRRLRIDCTKYLTACSGCTRKHAKCSWYAITPVETSWIDSGFEGELQPVLVAADEDLNNDNNGNGHGNGNDNGAQYSHLADSSVAQELADLDANLHPDLRSGSANAGDVLLLHEHQLGNGQHVGQRRGVNTNGEASAGGGSTNSSSSRRSASASSSVTAGRNHARTSSATAGLLLRGGRGGRNADAGANANHSAGGAGELYFGQMGGTTSAAGLAGAMGDGGEQKQQHR